MDAYEERRTARRDALIAEIMADHRDRQREWEEMKARLAVLEAARAQAEALANAPPRPTGVVHVPTATHAGHMTLGDVRVPCFVLEGGKRVISQKGMLKALGFSGAGTPGRFEAFLASDGIREGLPQAPSLGVRLSYIFDPEKVENPGKSSESLGVRFGRGGARGGAYSGYPATFLVDVCEAVLAARTAGRLRKNHLGLATRCEELVRAFARVGVVALVDEATGYQETREARELNAILEAFLSPELLSWTKRFPEEFFREVFRLRGWDYSPGARGPRYVGRLINKLVYERLPRGVLDGLRKMNPPDENGQRRARHHQWLTPTTGCRALDRQVAKVTALLQVSDDWDQFEALMARSDRTESERR